MATHKKILFLCTGNYYRSRFAEEYFNHLIELKGIKWRASSKGLSKNMPSPNNPGPISVHALEAIKERHIQSNNLSRYPQPIDNDDFISYHKIIALSKEEHEPMLKERFEQHLEKITYFEVGDLPLEAPKSAMHKISLLVEKLVEELK